MEENHYETSQKMAQKLVEKELEKLNNFIEILNHAHREFQSRRVDSDVHKNWFNSYRDNIMGATLHLHHILDIDLFNFGCDEFHIDEEFEQ